MRRQTGDGLEQVRHTPLVSGDRDKDAGAVSPRLCGKGPQGAKLKAGIAADIVAAMRGRQG